MHTTSGDQALKGKTILFVERSHVISLELYKALEKLGAYILGPICTADEAVLLIECLDVDGAVLNRDLSDDDRLTEMLVLHGVPRIYYRKEPQRDSRDGGGCPPGDASSDPLTWLKGLFVKTVQMHSDRRASNCMKN